MVAFGDAAQARASGVGALIRERRVFAESALRERASTRLLTGRTFDLAPVAGEGAFDGFELSKNRALVAAHAKLATDAPDQTAAVAAFRVLADDIGAIIAALQTRPGGSP